MAEIDDVRGSSPAMTTKDLVLELYRDMKVVRPAVEALLAADLPARVNSLEIINSNEVAARNERQRLGNLSNKALAVVIMVSQAVLAAWVALANGLHI